MSRALYTARLLAFLAGISLVACGGSAGTSLELPQAADAGATRGLHVIRPIGIRKIQHIVIIIQENRSFNNLFMGYPGAVTSKYGYISSGEKVKLKPIPLETTWDVEHDAAGFFAACNGTGSIPGTHCRMNGFNKESVGCGQVSYPPCPIKHPQYAYVPAAETAPYVDMAKQYVLADKMFTSNFDESSFVAHQYLIAAQSSSAVDYPDGLQWGCYGSLTIPTISQQRQILYSKRISVCFDNQTLGDELDGAGISWRSYTSPVPSSSGHLWNAYSAISHIYNGPDWGKDVISPQTLFLGDVKYGRLQAVSWITPTDQNSDHAGSGSNTGPSWVATLVNAVGHSQFWDSTAIFVLWDDPGGWYDPVAPAYVDYDGLGMRVPLLVISPYAKDGYVSHVPYELASILRFVEDRYSLAPLWDSDARATSPAGDCFNFKQLPRKFVTIPSDKGLDYFLRQPLDPRPPDDN